MVRRRNLLFAFLSVLFLLGCQDIRGLTPTDGPSGQPSDAPTMGLVVLDIGQGDSILVISPHGKTMLVDGGNSSRDGYQVILPYLQSHGLEKLDVMVLTHPDADHVGGLPTILRIVPVDFVVATGQVHTTAIYAEFLREVKNSRDSRGTKVLRGMAGVGVPFDSAVDLEVLGPGEDAIAGHDKNNASIVIRLTFGQIGVLLAGDAEREEEMWMLSRGFSMLAQVLKVSHHGSSTGSNDLLLEAIGGDVGLISCGADNPYGHPHAEALERFAGYGLEIYRTDKQGTLEVITDGSWWWTEVTGREGSTGRGNDEGQVGRLETVRSSAGDRDQATEGNSEVLRGVIDSLEGDWALVALDDEQRLDWPRGRLPYGAREGMAIVLDLDTTEVESQVTRGVWEGVVAIRAQTDEQLFSIQLGQQWLTWPVARAFSPGDRIVVRMEMDLDDTERRRQMVQDLVRDLFE